MKKYIPNILSSVRIVTALILIAFSGLSAVFLVLFCVCGITDVLDGPIARATGTTSTFGAKLDTAGDILMFLAMGKALLIDRTVTYKTVLWFLIPLFGMFVSAVIAKLRFNNFFFIHTVFAKLFGAVCFFLPFVALMTNPSVTSVYLTVLWVIGCITAIDMIAIQIRSNHPDSDLLLFLLVKKSNERFTEESAKKAEQTAREQQNTAVGQSVS